MSGRVSVIIPCHNAAPYLAETIGSVLNQSYPAHEIIVVDDLSTDASLTIARQIATTEPRMTVLEAHYGRASATRNRGAAEASGDLLMFLDADDVIRSDTLGALAGALRETPGAVAICPWFRLEYEQGEWHTAPASCRPRHGGEDALSAWLTGWYHPPCAVLWSRTAFDAAGRWDECATVNDDGDLMIRSLASGIPLVETAHGAGYYRRLPANHASLSSSRCTSTGLASRLRIIDKVAFRLQGQGQLARYRSAVADALEVLATDAGKDAGIAGQARALARYYRSHKTSAPPPHTRAPHAAFAHTVARESSAADGCPSDGPMISRRRPAPLVSIILPTFNRAHVLPRAMGCVLHQTCSDTELLIVDDGSSDDTANVVAATADRRVRYLRQKTNQGASAARNIGLRAARGMFVAFLDSDDEWLPDKLSRQLQVFAAESAETGLVYTGVERIEPDGRRTVQRPEIRGDVYRELLWHNAIHGGGSNVMMRSNVVASAGFFNEQLAAAEDYEYWLRVARFFRVEFVDAPLMRYHDQPTMDRRSRALVANLEARWWLYETYADEMRRAGVAHMFLLHTARWARQYGGADLHSIRPFLTRALREKPTSRMAVATLLGATVPGASQVPWVSRHAVIKDRCTSGF